MTAALNAILNTENFSYPLLPDNNIPAQALRAMTRAAIDLLRDNSDRSYFSWDFTNRH